MAERIQTPVDGAPSTELRCHCICPGLVQVEVAFDVSEAATAVRDRLVTAYGVAHRGGGGDGAATADPAKFAIKLVGYDQYLDTLAEPAARMGEFLYVARCRKQGAVAKLALVLAPPALVKRAGPEEGGANGAEGSGAAGRIGGMAPAEAAVAEDGADGGGTPPPPHPAEDERMSLDESINMSSPDELTHAQQELFFRHRDWLRAHRPERSLAKLLRSVNWDSQKHVAAAHRQLAMWPRVSAQVALQLLALRPTDAAVRAFAVGCLRCLDDAALESILLQLTQVAKHESYHSSPVADFLMDRAVRSPLIGHYFYWHLKAQARMPSIRPRDNLRAMLQTYQKCSGEYRHELLKQNELVSQLTRAALAIKAAPDKARPALLRKLLAEVTVPPECRLPLHPKLRVKGLRVAECKCMDSKKLPLWLVFENADPLGDDISVIYKAGDDPRQDLLTLQTLRVMDTLWRQDGLDLCMNAYRTVAVGSEVGMLEVVPNAHTTSEISKDAGGSFQCFMADPLAKWLRRNNPDDESYDRAVDNFVRSCAGYCVATCVLGIGDRHNDNIMVQQTGNLFHVDFGHFLGHFKSKFGFKRERAKFVFTPDFAFVMGGIEDPRFALFEDLCARAFNILRRHADTFTTLFELMLSSGIPELASTDDIRYLVDALLLTDDDGRAGAEFKRWIHQSLHTKTTQLNNAIHSLVH